jgi:hypothetical protein
MSAIEACLDQIAVEGLKLGIDVKAHMYPGLRPTDIAALVKPLPFKLPPEVIDFYLWQNGVRLEGQTCEIGMFPRLYFPSLARCVETTQILVSTVDRPLSQWKKSWYSLCEDFAGEYYALNSDRQEEVFGRVFAVGTLHNPFPAFWSFQTMVQSVLECYKAGAYYLDRKGFLREDLEKCHGIYRALNRGLSPLRVESQEELVAQVRRAKRIFESEGRSGLLEKLKEFAAMRKIDVDKL